MPERSLADRLLAGDKRALARGISLVEDDDPAGWELVRAIYPHTGEAAIVGFTVFVLVGVAAALAGVLVAMRLGSGSANQGVNFELTVITAVVLGGTNLFGGRGTVLGTVLGVLTLGFIENGLQLAHVSPFYVQIVQGAILLAAILANAKLFSRFTVAR